MYWYTAGIQRDYTGAVQVVDKQGQCPDPGLEYKESNNMFCPSNLSMHAKQSIWPRFSGLKKLEGRGTLSMLALATHLGVFLGRGLHTREGQGG